MKRLLEVCCGNLESVDAAVRGGAERIEFCSALELDGLTPSMEDLRTVKARYPSLRIHILIRPRAGDFQYMAAEIETMAGQVERALETGADGIVLGCLNGNGDPDVPALATLLRPVEDWNLAAELAASDLCHAANDGHFFPEVPRKAVSLTFHRAFDVCRDPFSALETLVGLGFDRILTSGQAPTAEAGIPLLKRLVKAAEGRIGILPGGGITPENAARILAESGAAELHASASTPSNGHRVTSADKVAALLRVLNPPTRAFDI